MKKRKLNVKLLRKIQAHITEEPRRFLMKDFVVRADNPKEWREEAEYSDDLSKTMPKCGTAACIAAWTNILTGASRRDEGDVERAAQKLGIGLDHLHWFDEAGLSALVSEV